MSENKMVRISLTITEVLNKNFIEIEPKRIDLNTLEKPRDIRIYIRKNPYSLIIHKEGRIILEEPLSE